MSAAHRAAEPALLRTCPSCGHDMTGLPAAVVVCPECGRMSAVLAEAEQERAEAAGLAPAMGTHAAKGFTFMLVQGVGTRIVALACQMILTHLLFPEHFGLLAIADSIATFANLFQLIGIREMLVSRQKKFDLWANTGFWIMTTTGWATGALIALSSPLIASAYGKPELIGVMLLIALSLPLYSMTIVPEAKLQSQLRFKYLAAILGTWAMLLPVLTVVFALLGFGVYSLVLPRVIVALLRLAMGLRAAKLPLRFNPQFRRWRYFASTSVLFFFTSALLLIVQMGDRPLLSIFVSPHEMGLYYFAFAFSLQTIMIISVNLQQVLFATLSKLNDEPARQLGAFLRASRTLAAIVTPICLIQAAASEPLVRTLFAYERWKDAVPAMQVLGLGMVFLGSYCPATAMLEAQRRFKAKFYLALFTAILFIAATLGGILLGIQSGGPLGGMLGAAIGVAATLAVTNPIWSYAAIRPMGGTWADTLSIVARPLIAASLAVAVALLAAGFIAPAAAGHTVLGRDTLHWARLFITGGVGCLAYLPLMRLLMPREFNEIAAKVVAAMRRLSPPLAATAGRMLGV